MPSSPSSIPTSGAETGRLTAIAPPGTANLTVNRVTLVDTASDTLAVFFYRVTYPESGLQPRRDEWRIQSQSRASGQHTLDTPVTLGGDDWLRAGWSRTDVVATDARGYVVLNYLPGSSGEKDQFQVLGLLPELKAWSVAEDCCRGSVAALAINGDVLLASRIGRADELRGYNLTTGQQLWRQPYDRDTISMDHPRCAVGTRIPLSSRAAGCR